MIFLSKGCTGVAPTTAECTNILQEIRNDLNRRKIQYENLVLEALNKEGDSRDNVCMVEDGESEVSEDLLYF